MGKRGTIVVEAFVYLGEDGQSVHLIHLWKRLAEKLQTSHNIVLLLPETSPEAGASILQDTQKSPFSIKFVPHSKRKRKKLLYLITALYYELYLIFYTARHRNKISLIYNRHRILGFAPLIQKALRIPVITEVNGIIGEELSTHDSHGIKALIRLQNIIDRKIVSCSNKIITVTPYLREYMISNYGADAKDVHVVPNGVDTRLFRPMDKTACREHLSLPKRKKYIVFVGALMPWQGLRTLIRAASLIVKESSNRSSSTEERPIFIIVGDGACRKDLEALVRKLGLENDIMFVGRVEHKVVPYFINAADVCVSPFTKERNMRIGLSPLKIYEYLACGKPVVSSAIPNLEFIMKQNVGYLVEPENSEKLATAILEALTNANDARSEAATKRRRYVATHNDWDKIALRCFSIITQVMRKKVKTQT